MITRENYSVEHIMDLHKSSKRDPNLIERVLFAFGLLEALRKVELPFIFKGGTSFLLILDKPMRLSTDVDIIVEPGTEVDKYLEKAAKIFPFKSYEEQIRKGKNNIEKRHFKFQFDSPRMKEPVEIILDILFESSKYGNTIEKDIDCELLITEPKYLQVKVPDINSILADKLTAFAPHTTGVLIDTRKDLEIMKQMFDVYSLINVFDDFNIVYGTYYKIVEDEIAYRGIDEQCYKSFVISKKATALAAATLRESTPWDIGIITVWSQASIVSCERPSPSVPRTMASFEAFASVGSVMDRD